MIKIHIFCIHVYINEIPKEIKILFEKEAFSSTIIRHNLT